MRKYDPTKCLTQMFFKPNVIPFCSVLLIISFYIIAIAPMSGQCMRVRIPQAENDHYELRPGILPTIFIDAIGRIWYKERLIDDLSKLPVQIADDIDLCPVKKDKILLLVDKDANFGSVQDVLKATKKANVETVGFVTHTSVSLAHILGTLKK